MKEAIRKNFREKCILTLLKIFVLFVFRDVSMGIPFEVCWLLLGDKKLFLIWRTAWGGFFMI